MFKLINYDICNGIAYIYKKLIALIVFILIMLVYNRFVVLNSPIEDILISTGDYLVYLFKGSKPFDIQNLDIPVVFIGIHMFIAMMIGYYAVDDIHGYGRQVFIRCGKKSRWWYSKCIWIVCTVVVSYSLLYLTVFAFSACSGAQMTYSMIMRNKYVLGTDMTCQTGIIFLVVVSIVCIVLGKVIVNKKDISL